MKTFRVVANVIRGRLGTATVASDGEQLEEAEFDNNETEVLRGYTVEVYDEVGAGIDETFYPVSSRQDEDEDNREEVLAQIARDFPPTEYQNHNW